MTDPPQVKAGNNLILGRTAPSRSKIDRKRFYQIISVCFAFGGAAGVYIGMYGVEELIAAGIPWSRALVISLSGAYLIALLGGSYLLEREIDETEKQIARKAGEFANATFITLYPVWFLLWKGGLVPEPMHVYIFIAFLVSMTLSSLFHRFR
jgi:hypothetical protein